MTHIYLIFDTNSPSGKPSLTGVTLDAAEAHGIASASQCVVAQAQVLADYGDQTVAVKAPGRMTVKPTR